MANALGTPGPPAGPGVVSALAHRLDQAGLIATQGAGMAVRTGVLIGPGTTTLVTGTSATGTMTYAIAAHHWVSTRGTADGVYQGATEAAQTVSTTAAPGANSRIDVIWEKQQDQYSTLTPDATSAPQYGVTQGTAAASPTKPPIPVGALELATAVVAVGATSTNGANVTITNSVPQTSARGAAIPVRNQAERTALEATAYPGLHVTRLDLGGVIERWVTGTTWVPYLSSADKTLGDAYLAAQVLLAATPTWTDIVSVTATSTGGLCVARWTGTGFNAASGIDRTMDWQLLCDAAVIGSFSGVAIPLTGGPRVPRVAAFSSTPAAGAHTWKLQARASAASSVYAETALLTVVER